MQEETRNKARVAFQLENRVISVFIIVGLMTMSIMGFSQAFIDMSVGCGFNVTGSNHGVAVGDFNNDGLEDIYVSRRSARNLLYVNRGGFEFDEEGEKFGVDHPGETNASLWFDFDNDGDLDLFVGNQFEANVLYRNDGTEFTNVTDEFGVGTSGNLRSVNAVDFDNDGDLDLYVAYVFAQNILWKNERGTAFEDYTTSAGIDDTGRSLGAIFFDYDNDGDQDLFQTRDGDDANLFYENTGNGKFIDKSSDSGLDYVGHGMGADIADLNGDGFPDIYLTNLFENKLYINNTIGGFEEVSGPAGVDDVGMGWGTFFVDCNNNGLRDIYVANDSYFGVNGTGNIPNQLFVNKGDLKFEAQDYVGNIQNVFGSYGSACADFDLDGKLDIVVVNQGSDGNQIFKNTSVSGNYIAFKLKGVESNQNGVGSRVEIYAGEEWSVDYVIAGSGYASQGTNTLHFGLDEIEEVDSAIVYWPSGEVQKLTSLSINQVNIVIEGQNVNSTGAVVWTNPPFPNQLDDITVFYDASEGNGALEGLNGSVYAHAGVITNLSSSDADWKHVIGNWGTADARVLMTSEGNDIYSLSYNIQDFYGVDDGEQVLKLAFVFRNVDGSIVGRNLDGSDIYTDVYPVEDNLFMTVRSPAGFSLVYDDDSLEISVLLNKEAVLRVYDNGILIYADTTDEAEFYIVPDMLDLHYLEFVATTEDDTSETDEYYFVVESNPALIDPPPGLKNGLNYFTDSTYIFQLYAPFMDHVFVVCPENDYLAHSDFRCHLGKDSSTFWIELPVSYFENDKNSYQYLVGTSLDPFNSVQVADPYAVAILDPNSDQWVNTEVLAEWPPYPEGQTGGAVTVFDVEYEAYDWTNEFDKPAKTDLVIYELLMRDFLHDHSYTSLIDTLDYFEKLGVNAIELMPVNEFEGNRSWGYNPSFHMALDKYYGSRDQFKRFIDEAHSRGIAVILDVVYNHAFSQSPFAQMYWNNINNRPAANNPWLNAVPRHPYNVGSDFNHESQATKDFVKQVMEYWIMEFHVDGFRLDLSKGFTQTNSLGNEGLMWQYDASRIAILKDYADHVWTVDSNSYVILEHFAENKEEKELSNYGMMIWGNANHEFNEAAMGYTSDLDWGSDYTSRGWDDPHLVSYMESHDEERLMYKTLKYGDSNEDYNTKDLKTALRRIEAVSALFYSIPGPKTFWQFGEQGYDFSINRCTDGTISHNCRLSAKPIRWDYLTVEERKRLTDRVAAMIHLKTEYPTFATTDFNFNDANFYLKTVHLNHPDMDAVTLVNYRIINSDINPKFQRPGIWYEYFSGDSLEVVDTQEKLTFGPGEYRIYTSKRITPPGGFFTGVDDIRSDVSVNIFPNPAYSINETGMKIEGLEQIEFITLTDINGVSRSIQFDRNGDNVRFESNGEIGAGMYFIQVYTSAKRYTGKVVIVE